MRLLPGQAGLHRLPHHQDLSDMRKIIFMGRSGSGKTTLKQALRGEGIHYDKTQYIHHGDAIIDTPGEYCESKHLGRALALYAYEADVVGLLISSIEEFSIYSPGVTSSTNRETIGIVTQIDRPEGDPARAERWLRLAGCKKIFYVSAKEGTGLQELMDYLDTDGPEAETPADKTIAK